MRFQADTIALFFLLTRPFKPTILPLSRWRRRNGVNQRRTKNHECSSDSN